MDTKSIQYFTILLSMMLACVAMCDIAVAQPGRGRSQGQGFGRGPGMSGELREDMATLHAMFAARDKITRTVKMLENGAETTTESDDARELASRRVRLYATCKLKHLLSPAQSGT